MLLPGIIRRWRARKNPENDLLIYVLSSFSQCGWMEGTNDGFLLRSQRALAVIFSLLLALAS